ncbi:MAG: methyltransferase, partial [Spirochaetia bacterium]|nr:methyltransferase [Spirochaetia bacterium]
KGKSNVANVHAGLDETSHLLRLRYSNVTSYDFFNSEENTENSIERARKAYANTDARNMHIGETIDTCEVIFLILAAHEIRKESSRVDFFKGLKKSLKRGGTIIVIEHLRNLANLLAFGHGFLHFLSDRTWRQSFRKANLDIKNEFSITPFLQCYILQ